MKQSMFHVYKGGYVYKRKTGETPRIRPFEKIYSKNVKKKAIVFDLDETVGSFSDLYDIWSNIYTIDVNKDFDELSLIHKEVFFSLLDLFPEFIRPGIFSIFQCVVDKIKIDQCHKIFIYTNNQCKAKYWVSLIISYIDRKLGVDIGSPSWFAPPVCAFKIGERIIEPRRTTHDKTYKDLVKCTTLPANVEICFIDDKIHDNMKTQRVFYINPPPYSHELSKGNILERFRNSNLARFLFRVDKIPVLNVKQVGLPLVNEKNQKHMEVYYKILFFIEEFFSMVLSQNRKKTAKNGKLYFETETKSYDASAYFQDFAGDVNWGSSIRSGRVFSASTRFGRVANTRKNRQYTNIEKVIEKYKYPGV